MFAAISYKATRGAPHTMDIVCSNVLGKLITLAENESPKLK
jgi:hypothetical protein